VNIPVVYEDDWLLVMNKPAGLLTIPTPKKESRTLTSILNADLKERGLFYRLYPCHRLDRETSGLVVYAKGKSMQKKMATLFKNKEVKKIYVAFVQGLVSCNQGEIKTPIAGLSAITRYKVMQRRKDFTVVEVKPLTGRTNQIRIHFKQTGHPLLGETKYAFRRDFKLRAKRLCLHAKTLEFMHPLTKKVICFTAPLPADIQDFLNKH
jgi:23S rRNA pseudouridine1911/1915/1917 synthase